MKHTRAQRNSIIAWRKKLHALHFSPGCDERHMILSEGL